MKDAIHLDPKNLQFSAFSSQDIKKLSVTRVVTSITFDELGHPLPGGFYDPAMGPYSIRGDPCATCFLTSECPGHTGHIELSMLVYNPMFIKTVYEILRISCIKCFKLQISDHCLMILDLQLKLIERGYIIEAQQLDIFKLEMYAQVDTAVKLESGGSFHPDIVKYAQLLDVEPDPNPMNTKTTETIRLIVMNSTLKQKVGKNCLHCHTALKKVRYSYKRLVMTYSKNERKSRQTKDSSVSSTGALLPDECRDYFRKLYNEYRDILPNLFPILRTCSRNIVCPVDIFFQDIILVTPPIMRPATRLGDRLSQHPQTAMYRNILLANVVLKAIISKIDSDGRGDSLPNNESNASNANQSQRGTDEDVKLMYDGMKGNSPYEKMYNAWQELQTAVDQCWDGYNDRSGQQGLKQIIEKKDGLIRKHMMGKRVNFAARTVITPDPNINIDEIGIPDVFARKLSYPVPVTNYNVVELRRLVMNGPDIHPGANFIEDERGYVQMIPGNNPIRREGMAKMLLSQSEDGTLGKVVHRHLVNGDILLMNRQPSLHKNSIMAHRARILKGEKTFRLHYSNCKSYNADFDGDEMNAHCPQTELGRSEGYNIVNVANQYLVPKDGTPLGGLIQDHVISGVKLTMRGRFFNREDYQQLVFDGLNQIRGDIKLLPPTILKPIKLWSGKQILSTIILNLIPNGMTPINLTSTAKLPARSWQNQPAREWLAGGTPLSGDAMTEAEVCIVGGELLVGVLDKTHYGATPYGLIHCMYELYGGQCSTNFLSSLSKLFTVFLQREGFTLGIHDILLIPKADKKRKRIIKKCRQIGHETAAAALNLPADVSPNVLAEEMEKAYARDDKFRTILDRKYKSVLDSYTNSINTVCLPAGLLSKFPQNNLQLMVNSGAKGSAVNTMQISCLLGQIELEGKRPPLMISGRALPSFATFETSPKSGGFIDGRFMTGIQPQDFFFHCMAGREGLIDTAVKTSRSGYLQRCLIKHLEGLNVHYDMTVRDSDGTVIQFMYGEDGMDILKSQFFVKEQLGFLDGNAGSILDQDLVGRLKNDLLEDSMIDQMNKHDKSLRSWLKRHRKISNGRYISSFQQFSADMSTQVTVKNPMKQRQGTSRLWKDDKIIKLWMDSDAEQKMKYGKKSQRCPDPLISRYKQDLYFGSVSEKTDNLIQSFIRQRPERKDDFIHLMCIKNMKALVAPGEPVGLLAAQSIGEPSTQMTLNTFHFAGRGEMNVTLGIPRLREILMMASKQIKTPSMDIPFLQKSNMDKIADKLRLKLAKCTVADVLESINVRSKLVLNPERVISYTLRFNFLPRDMYKDDYSVKPKQILKYMSGKFFKLMFRSILKITQSKNTIVVIGTEKKKRDKERDDNDDEIDDKEPEMLKRGPDDEGSDEEPMEGDGDATDAKLRGKDQDENDYDEPDVEEEVDKESDNEEEVIGDELFDEKEDDGNDLNEKEEQQKFVASIENVEQYIFDVEKHLWCEVTFHLPMQFKNVDLTATLRDVAQKATIVEVPNIKRAIIYPKEDDLILKTEGINIIEMFQYNKILDLNRLYSNHVHAMGQMYGIEAAARVIVKEITNVFAVYGITVDPRHLLLIADYMTFDGTYKPLSRSGMASSASPLQKMSFESSLQCLKMAIVSGTIDQLDSPSSRLMVGQACKSGTGSFSLISDCSFLLDLYKTGI